MYKSLSVALMCVGTPLSHAQCENSFTLALPNASSAKYVYQGPVAPANTYSTQPVTALSFTPDRRPGVWHSFYTANRWCDSTTYHNPKALTPYWAKAIWDNATPSTPNDLGIKQRFDSFITEGFRRITINRPGGNILGQYVPQAHYHHLDDDQKDLLEIDLADWIDDTLTNVDADFELAVFIGSWQSGHPAAPGLGNSVDGTYWDCTDDDTDLGFYYRSDPGNTGTATSITAANCFVDPKEQSSMQETYQNFVPWLDIGCTAIWLDNSADASHTSGTGYLGRDRTIDLIQSPDYSAVNFVGEGIPWYNDTTGHEDIHRPLTDYLEAMPWMATDSFADDRGWRDTASTISVDPSTTEAIIVFQSDNGATTLAQMASMRDRGFVIWVSAQSTDASLSPSSVKKINWLQRLYPELTSSFSGDMADFNDDGTVDCDDYDLFFTNWYDSFVNGSDYFGIWDGDLDGDGDADWDDVNYFGTLSSWTGC